MEFWAAGKLLLFGEYLVLRGSKSLAIPLTMGQSLTVNENESNTLEWKSKTSNKSWFEASFSLDLMEVQSNNEPVAEKLLEIFRFIRLKQPQLFEKGLSFETNLNFKREWGLGSSSTLISLLSQWSKVDAYQLLANSFGGSGYDVACATATSPILYEVINHQTTPVIIHRPIIQRLLFVYLGNKQDSQKEVIRFNEINVGQSLINEMNQIVETATQTHDIIEFEQLMYQSESLLSSILKQPTLKSQLFEDYPYAVKSLGAWGGDFFMATFRDEEEARYYFLEKGYNVQFNYFEVLKNR